MACSTSNSAGRNETTSERTAAHSEATPADDARTELVADLPNGAQPFEGIVTSGQPTPEQFDRLDDAGIQTVVNLRPHSEKGARNDRRRAEQMGLQYINIPIAGAEDLNRENVERFHDALQDHPALFLVHCSSSNRVGAIFALRAFWLQEKSAEESLEIGRRAGLSSLEEAVRDRMSD
jgi:uncharacterized protein (TIGR01244 family)